MWGDGATMTKGLVHSVLFLLDRLTGAFPRFFPPLAHRVVLAGIGTRAVPSFRQHTSGQLVRRSASVVMLLLAVLSLQHMPWRLAYGSVVSRRTMATYAVEDNFASGRGMKGSFCHLPVCLNDGHMPAVVDRPHLPSPIGATAVFSRTIAIVFTLHLLYTQTTSTAT